jgi:enoyl-CoA hydratase/carnithine racemase
MGAGLSIAALADHVVAARDAKFGAAFVKMGLMPDMGALWSLQHRVGRAKARELLGLARSFDGAEAGRIGLANEVVEPGQALNRAIAVAQEYAALPPVATALLKSALGQGVDSLDAAMRSEVEFQAVAMSSKDHAEAVRAFMEKRAPKFEGR